MKILVGIPCFNCSNQIARVLKKLEEKSWDCDFLAVDNSSTDGTLGTLRTWQAKRPFLGSFTVIAHQENYGLGGSFKTIYSHALKGHYDALVIFHGDDQASAGDLERMLQTLKQEKDLDCILGARFMRGSVLSGYSKIREWGNRLINAIFTLALGRKIFDIGSGLNAFKVAALPEEILTRYPDHIAYDLHLLFHFVDHGRNLRFLPITWNESDQVSNAKNVETGIKVLQILVLHLLGKDHWSEQTILRKFEEYES